MSTPPPHRSESTPPAKTPGWHKALFGRGIFSTAKKTKAVDFSTMTTGSASRSPLASAKSRSIHISLTSPSERMFAAEASNTSPNISAVDALVAMVPSGSPEAHSTAEQQSVVAMETKSPWKSQGNGVRFSHGDLKPLATKKAVPKKATLRTKRKSRPAALLMRAKRRKNNPIDPHFAVNALQLSRNVFEPSARQIEARQNYASFKTGKRLLGSQQHASRLPSNQPVAPAEKPEEPVDESMQMLGGKRKQVSFNQANQPVETLLTTPVRSELPRKGTPFKPHQAAVDSAMKSPGSAASLKPSKFATFPQVELEMKAPYNDFGSEFELEKLGPPVSVGHREHFAFSATLLKLQQVSEEANFFDPPKDPPPKQKKENEQANDEEDKGNPTKKRKDATWVCEYCENTNDFESSMCQNDSCKKFRKKKEAIGWAGLFVNATKKWKCEGCFCHNEEKDKICPSCEAPRPGYEQEAAASKSGPSSAVGVIGTSGFTFGSAPAAADSSSGGFNFGGVPSPNASGATSVSSGGFKFGGAAVSSAPASGGFTFGGTPAAPSDEKSGVSGSTGFSFVSTKTDSLNEEKKLAGFSFGGSAPLASPKKDEAPKATAFTFGKPDPAVGNGDKLKPQFGFDPSGSLEKSDEPPKPAVSFGGSANTTSENTPPPKMRVPSAPATAPMQKRSRPANGDISLSHSATKVPDKKPFSFTATNSTENNNDSKSKFSFGSSSASSNAPKPSFSFGNSAPAASQTAAAPQSADKPTFSFGQAPAPTDSQKASSESKPLVALGSVPSSDNEDHSKRRRNGDEGGKSSSVPAFGATSASSAPPAFIFGNSSAAVPAPAAPLGALFGSTPAATIANGGDISKPSAPAATFGSTPAGDSSNQFGGAPAAAGGMSFGSSSASTPAPSLTFGSSGDSNQAPVTAPTFGASSNSAPVPDSSAQMFGSSAPTPPTGSSTPAPPLFGSTPAVPTFGSSAPVQSLGSNPFGAAPAPASSTPGFSFGSAPAPAFGSTPAPPPAPGFGSTPVPPAFGSTPAPNQPPAFGSTPAPVVPAFGSVPAPAHFGGAPAIPAPAFGSAPAPAPGFSFGGAPQQPPAFGAAPAPAPFGSTPAQAPGFGGGFGSTPSTPAPPGGFGAPPQQPGGFGGGFGQAATPSAPPMGMGGGGAPQFSIGSAGTRTPGTRRRIKARRPGGSRPA